MGFCLFQVEHYSPVSVENCMNKILALFQKEREKNSQTIFKTLSNFSEQLKYVWATELWTQSPGDMPESELYVCEHTNRYLFINENCSLKRTHVYTKSKLIAVTMMKVEKCLFFRRKYTFVALAHLMCFCFGHRWVSVWIFIAKAKCNWIRTINTNSMAFNLNWICSIHSFRTILYDEEAEREKTQSNKRTTIWLTNKSEHSSLHQ